MTLSTKEYAFIAKHVYGEDEPLKLDKPIEVNGVDRFQIIKIRENASNGYCGVVYQDLATGELVVAHRGTESQIKDIKTDAGMALLGQNNQAQDALALTR